ncbi:MAG TPA: phosphatidate cytidylyltransferase [Casimicrobiaceae bacterium]|nr:phosphatidate cytidylyltransferase [Casimicrobiaceae bacterium]
MLSTRIVTALIAVAVVLSALFLLPPRGFAVALLVVVGAAAREWSALARLGAAGSIVFVGVVLLAGGGLILAGAGSGAASFTRIALAVCSVATLFWVLVATPWVVRRWPPRSGIALALSGWIVLLGAFVALVELDARSPWLVLAAMAIVWIADIAAYFSGRAFGRHKLAPLVSPGKTWEGVYGALAAVGLYSLCLVPLAHGVGYAGAVEPRTVAAWLAFAVAVAALSVVGDLFESWLKRNAGVKDSGRLLPGHGGVLDRIDALLAAMPPVALAALLALPPA